MMGSLLGDKFNLANKKWCRGRSISPLWLIFVLCVLCLCVVLDDSHWKARLWIKTLRTVVWKAGKSQEV